MGMGRPTLKLGGARLAIEAEGLDIPLRSGFPTVSDRTQSGLTSIQWAQGTWATQQVTSMTDFNNRRATILSALQHPGVVGFSMRWPWKNFIDPVPIMDAGRAVAAEAGKRFCVRFMAGQHTPDSIFDAGADWFLLSNGNRCPKPWRGIRPDLYATNAIFEDAWFNYCKLLADYSKAHAMRVLHISWFGALWAELFHGPEVQNAEGYSYTNWLNGHKSLINRASVLDDASMAIEVPTSGHGTQGTVFNDVVGHIQSVNGASFPHWWIQQNNYDWNDETNSGTGNTVTRTVHSAAQMVGIGDYNWAKVYEMLRTNGKKYLEVYIFNSFTGANRNALFAEAAAFPYFP